MFSTNWNVKLCKGNTFLRVIKRSLSVSRNRESVKELASKNGELRVFIVAGEVSGDIIASRFMNSLKNLSHFPIRFAGVGGSLMSNQGLQSIFPMEDITVMGIWELLPHLSKFRVKLKETVESAVTFQPHVVLTVDSKGFSFRFLKKLRARYDQQNRVGPRHFHYVAPSFWAWRGGEARLKGLTTFVDHVFCILPFEADVCRSKGLAATFVGHPTLEDVLELKGNIVKEYDVLDHGEDFRKNHGIASGATIISVLPGSRLQEVQRMLPIYSRTMDLLKDSISGLTTIIHIAPNKHVEEYINKAIRRWPVPFKLVPGGSSHLKYDSFCASRVALCTSGTVAVELQLARLPCVVAYRAHLLTELFIRYKADIPYISLSNILLNSPIIPEALFGDCNPSRLARLLMELVYDENLRQKQISAAPILFDLLNSYKTAIGNQTEDNFVHAEYTPSMIAASVVLKSLS